MRQDYEYWAADKQKGKSTNTIAPIVAEPTSKGLDVRTFTSSMQNLKSILSLNLKKLIFADEFLLFHAIVQRELAIQNRRTPAKFNLLNVLDSFVTHQQIEWADIEEARQKQATDLVQLPSSDDYRPQLGLGSYTIEWQKSSDFLEDMQYLGEICMEANEIQQKSSAFEDQLQQVVCPFAGKIPEGFVENIAVMRQRVSIELKDCWNLLITCGPITLQDLQQVRDYLTDDIKKRRLYENYCLSPSLYIDLEMGLLIFEGCGIKRACPLALFYAELNKLCDTCERWKQYLT